MLCDAFRQKVKSNLLTFAARQGSGIGRGAGLGLGLGLESESALAPNTVSSGEALYDMGEATNRSEIYDIETGTYMLKTGKSYGLLAGVASVGMKGSRNDASTYNYG